MESTVATSTASSLAVLRPGSLSGYWRFQRAVAKAQLAAWLPAGRRLLVDISGPAAACPAQAAGSGHAVVRVVTVHPGAPPAAERDGAPAARIAAVVAESGSLAFLADGCADGVIAEDGALSRHLMAEDLAAEIARVLRPGGEVLACVDSLVLGMAMLAEQRHWAHLTDLPHAEVVLIPWPDGTITRCFGRGAALRPAHRGGPGGHLDPAADGAVPVHRGSRAPPEPGALARLVRAELPGRPGPGGRRQRRRGVRHQPGRHRPQALLARGARADGGRQGRACPIDHQPAARP